MQEEKQAEFERLKTAFEQDFDLNFADLERLHILAAMSVEMRKLQAFIDEHGPTYTVRGKSGDTYSRTRPEYQQLQDSRQRYSVLLSRIQGNTRDSGETAFIAL